MEAQNHKYLELLSAIAGHLGYKKLQQTDIDKFYSPQAHVDQLVVNYEMQRELLRVLKSTAQFVVEPKKDDPLGMQ